MLILPQLFKAAPLPLVIWHGLGDSTDNDGLRSVGDLAQQVHPGTYVHFIQIGADGGADRTATFWGNLNDHVDQACEQLKADETLATAPAIDAIGFSQGGLFLRGYAERCKDGPQIRSLVTFGSPHSGIADIRCGDGDWLCKGATSFLRGGVWSGWVQSNVVPAQYFRPLDPETHEPTAEFLDNSNYLADVNNERVEKNKEYAEQLSKLEKFVMYMFSEDETVVPKESAWFSDVYLETNTVVDLRNRTLYKEDWLGLKKLDDKGALEFRIAEGRHMLITDELLTDAFEKYFGPPKSSLRKLEF